MDEKIKGLISQMTDKELVSLGEGRDSWHTMPIPRLGVEAAMMADGPHGMRVQDLDAGMTAINDSHPATCFPTAATTGCSWDRDLLGQVGAAIGREALSMGVSLVLGPGLNIKRSPLCGRNFEYYSEDPLLSGEMAAACVSGMQTTGVGACVKHFAANSQEYKRFSSDSVLDERTLREIYLAGFETVVKKAQPWCVMSSYNKINGVHASDSKWLLTDVLRREWGFAGFVVSDWGGTNDRALGFQAGMDLCMPGGAKYQQKQVRKALKDGKLDRSCVEQSAARVLEYVQKASRLEKTPFDRDAHHTLARVAAEKSAVLLKNSGALPLSGSACLIGHMANVMRYQGAGSSHINPTRLVSPCDCLDWPYAPGCEADGSTNDALLHDAAELAASVDTAVLVVGLPDTYEAEGFDRTTMQMPEGHLRLIEAVSAANANTVVVLLCGSPVETPWLDRVSALLYMGLPGQAGGEALTNLPTDRSTPSGKLTETWPLCLEDAATFGNFALRDAEYREAVFVGYRYYDAAKKPVRFPFGFGLSYTTFACSDLTVEGDSVRVTVKNTGSRAGEEVVQLYVCPPGGGLFRPLRELRDFQKVLLQPGEEKTVEFTLTDRSFALWAHGWKVHRGEYGIEVGGLRAVTFREGEEIPAPAWQAGSWYETLAGRPSREDWLRLLGREHISQPPRKGSYTMDSTVVEMKETSRVMALLHRITEKVVARGFGGKADYSDASFRMMMTTASDCALRAVGISAKLPDGVMKALLWLANHGM